jgi:hypothetical protein
MRAMLLIVLLGVAACAGKSAGSGEPKNDESDGDSTSSGAMPSTGSPGTGTGGTAGAPSPGTGGVNGPNPGGCGGIPGTQSCGGVGNIGGTGADGGVAGTAPTYGGAPLTHPLIKGPEICPDYATLLRPAPDGTPPAVCPGPEVACVYQGLPAGAFPPTSPFRCECTPGIGWQCVSSDENGETNCPFRTDQPCDRASVPNGCEILSNFAMGTALCICQDDGEGAGGADSMTSGTWLCLG